MNESAAQPAGVKTCPRCAEDVEAAALVCRFCGYSFTPAREESTSTIAAPRRASFGRRLAAYLFDIIGLYIPVIIVWAALGTPGGDASNVLGAAYFLALAAYFIWFWMQGATLGMRALGIRVEDAEGLHLDLSHALSRLVALALQQSFLLIVAPLILFLIFRIFKRPYWLDTVSHTRVVMA